jgi:hypothetical protein
MTSPDVAQPQVRDTTPKLQDVIPAAKPNLSDTDPEISKSSSPSTETSLLWTAMTMDGPTVYYRSDMGDARPIRQPQRGHPLAKQADVGEKL